jgi:uncharacterized protein (UPF0332 family)
MMDGGLFLTFAAKLAASGASGPAGYRSAVSRAYYGAFHLSREFLDRLGYRCRSDNEHHWVQRHFLNCQVAEAKEIGRLLANLHESRKAADYNLQDSYCEVAKNAQFCVERADFIQNQLRVCGEAKLKADIQSDMNRYRKQVNLA